MAWMRWEKIWIKIRSFRSDTLDFLGSFTIQCKLCNKTLFFIQDNYGEGGDGGEEEQDGEPQQVVKAIPTFIVAGTLQVSIVKLP